MYLQKIITCDVLILPFMHEPFAYKVGVCEVEIDVTQEFKSEIRYENMKTS